MAKFGLQTIYLNDILTRYFGNGKPNTNYNELYVGLGLTQEGSDVNMETFNEVFAGQPLGNYQRARVIFGKSNDGVITNSNEIVFTTASEDWTDATHKIEMIGIFNTQDYENVTPLVVLPLPKYESIIKGETIVLAPDTIQLSLTDL